MQKTKRYLILSLSLLLMAGIGRLRATGQEEVANLINRGKTFYENGDYDLAVVKFMEALNQDLNPQQEAEARFHLALSYFAVARNEKMKEQLDKLFEIDANREIDAAWFPPDFVEAFMSARKNVVAERTEKYGKNPQAGEEWKEPKTGMVFVRIPSGRFLMGSNRGESDEKPVHEVELDGFWMGECEVTQGQWIEVMGQNPSGAKKGIDYPVTDVSWNDAQKFIGKLNDLNKATGITVRLPTEAEWEYACRSGGSGDRYGNLSDIAWYSENSGGSTHQVRGKGKNVLGLYDMLGNVWEWCQDWYELYSLGFERNPQGPNSGSLRIFRGGAWGCGMQYVRFAYRGGSTSSFRLGDLGFRLVMNK